LARGVSGSATGNRSAVGCGYLLDRERGDEVQTQAVGASAMSDDPRELVLDIFVDGIPMTKGSWRIFGRKLVPDNEGEPEWAATVAWTARAKLRNAPAVKARYAVVLEFTLPAPQGRKLYRRDLDKLMRSILDALEGVVWTNDEQVEWARLGKMRGDKPGARIIVERLGA
jgi:Holliday junction resolvase RusA-like endonuclease